MSKDKKTSITVIAMTGIYPRRSSGPGIFLFGLITELSRRGTSGVIFTPPEVQNIAAVGSYKLYTWTLYPSLVRRAWSYLALVLKCLYTTSKSDIVIFNSPPTDIFSFAVLLYSWIVKKPSIWIVHGGIFGENLKKGILFTSWLGITVKTMTTFVTVSNALAEIVYRQTNKHSVVIYNALSGVDPISRQFYHTARAPAPSFLFLGRLARVKRVDLLLRAFTRIAEKYPESKLTVVGNGPEEYTLRVLAQKLDPNRVTFMGALEGDLKIKVLDQSDVLILPSDFEPFGLVILEAWARGLGVIGANTGGIKEIITHGKTGLLFEPGNLTDLVDCMTEICDYDLRKRLAVDGHNELLSRYTWATAGDKYLALIEELAK